MTKDKLPDVLPWERREREHHAYKVGIAVFLILLVGIVIGVNIGPTVTDPPTTTTTTTTSGSNDSHSGNNVTSPTPPPNNTNPTSPPPPSPATTLVYGVVNPAGVSANLSAPGWTLMFNSTNGVFESVLVLQWNEWRTNYWFTYAIVLTSEVSYHVTVHQGYSTWATMQGSFAPSGANFSQNFITTGNPY